jgi:hypothetical protein
MEVDLVVHSGESMAGSFPSTLVLTDIASEWTECVAIPVREAVVVVDIVTRLRPLLPFQIVGIDTDNGSEFLNEVMLAYCREANIEFLGSLYLVFAFPRFMEGRIRPWQACGRDIG